ncbi:hypothetical protein TRFO_43679 [Tritrichomonas foetus]|uniref:Rab-GAP TBC domain-containing protein n=1 Tax=Tritrichomonas foetus TaxID=1144522 RepID=A0A1J4KJ34_9EUKA|nr:hypothetical protein TRFO_43679 [Tritrichomonas foetus]|eukprot:OHT10952.1 hypothetical protein TRFO_43679 [Tritrichomonas foetus]
MINYQPLEAYLLINTMQPASMHQFIFPQNSSYQLLHFAQLLSLHSELKASPPQNSLETTVDFIVESYAATENHYHLFEFTVDKNKMEVPVDFSINGLLPQNVDFVKPDLHIISQFKVKSEDFTNNPVKKEDLDTFSTIEDLKDAVMNRGVEPSLRSTVWPIIFNIIPFDKSKRDEVLKQRVDEYVSVKKQWQNMTKMQLKYFTVVRDAFATIRVDVKRTHPPEIIAQMSDWAETLTSILRTFTMWNLDVRYTQGLNDLAVNIMAVFIPYISGDEGEALVFWCFAAFVELIASGLIAENMMVMQDRELTNIMSIIGEFHPACEKWLRTNGLGDLSFLISSFILAYGRSFTQDSIARIWEALVCVEAPWLFLRYFSASLLILSFPSFQKIPNCSTGKLVSTMDQIFYSQEIGAIIGVSLSMMRRNGRTNTEGKEALGRQVCGVEEVMRTAGRVLFEPVSIYNKIYEEVPSLFE